MNNDSLNYIYDSFSSLMKKGICIEFNCSEEFSFCLVTKPKFDLSIYSRIEGLYFKAFISRPDNTFPNHPIRNVEIIRNEIENGYSYSLYRDDEICNTVFRSFPFPEKRMYIYFIFYLKLGIHFPSVNPVDLNHPFLEYNLEWIGIKYSPYLESFISSQIVVFQLVVTERIYSFMMMDSIKM
jgi:hypothetical protein